VVMAHNNWTSYSLGERWSFTGFDPNGIPEFARARKAMQYAASRCVFGWSLRRWLLPGPTVHLGIHSGNRSREGGEHLSGA
jgi:hypothetical protein